MLLQLLLIITLQLLPTFHCYLLNQPLSQYKSWSGLDHRFKRHYNSYHEYNPTSASSLFSAPTRIYFDINVDDEALGRLIFKLDNPGLMPLHTENLIKLSTGEKRSIDSRCSYIGCKFKYSSQFVEGLAQYRWAHVLDGRGFNAVATANERIKEDPQIMRSCTHSIYGGVYYGLKYDYDIDNDDDDEEGDAGASNNGVVITVPLVGAYRGSTSFSIVRVGESPQEWKERLLSNSAVLGRLESGIEVLRTMARQTRGPPTIASSGLL